MDNTDNPHGFDEATLRRLEALRRHRAALIARRAATAEQTEAQGIRPNADQMVNHMNNWQSSSSASNSSGAQHTITTTARRIYRFNTTHPTFDYNEALDEDQEFEAQWEGMLAQQGLQNLDSSLLSQYREIARQRLRSIKKATAQWNAANKIIKPKPSIDLIASLCTASELMDNVCRFLSPADIATLYSVAKDFHHSLNQYMRSSVLGWARDMAPNAARIYSSPTYSHWFIPDPAGRRVTMDDYEANKLQPDHADSKKHTEINQVIGGERHVPGLVWLQRVVAREIRARDIIATLARMGHRLPKGAQGTLQKLWAIMDASASATRMVLICNQDFFTDDDLYIAQMFVVKLNLCFNDPVFGPRSGKLMRLMLGQKGLSPLWALLRRKKYTTKQEIRQLKIRYDVPPTPHQLDTGRPMWDIDIDQMGVVHLEGWGSGGERHLMRPDELIPLEASRRGLPLNNSVLMMAIHGHVDLKTGRPLVPDIDEMYMSDHELGPVQKMWTPLSHELANGGCGNVPFEPKMWKPKHARKARWNTLTPEVKKDILAEEEEEIEQVKSLNKAQDEYKLSRHNLKRLHAAANSREMSAQTFKIMKPDPEKDWEEDLRQLRIVTHDPDDGVPPPEDVDMGEDMGDYMDEDADMDMGAQISEDLATDSQPSESSQGSEPSHDPSLPPQQPEDYDASPEASDRTDDSSSSDDPTPRPPRIANRNPQSSTNLGDSEPSDDPSSSPEEEDLADLDSDDLSLETISSTEFELMCQAMGDPRYNRLTQENLQRRTTAQLVGPAPGEEDERDPLVPLEPPTLSPTPEPAPLPALSFSSPSSPDSEDDIPFDPVTGRILSPPFPDQDGDDDEEMEEEEEEEEEEDEEEEDEDGDEVYEGYGSDEGDVDAEGYWIPPENRNAPIPSPPGYGATPRLPSPTFLEAEAPERTILTDEEVQDALIAQADMEYDSDQEAEFEEGAAEPGIDWHDFLERPGAYMVQDMDVPEEEEREDEQEDEDDNGDGPAELHQAETSDAPEDEIRRLTGRKDDNEEEEDGSEQGLDEDEKKRRRDLKNWYRPW